MSLGFEQAGFDVLAAVEYDPIHAATYRYNFPRTTVLCCDIRRLTGQAVLDGVSSGATLHGRSAPAEVDVVFGGPPCQGFSIIGPRRLDDARNKLLAEFRRLVLEIRPKSFVLENVPGLNMGKTKGTLEALVADFRASGYVIKDPIRALDASLYGVPQARRRIFLVGSRVPHAVADFPAASTARHGVRDARSADALVSTLLPEGPSVADAIGDLPNIDDIEVLRLSDECPYDCISETQTSRQSSYVRRLNEASDHSDFSYPRIWAPSVLTSSLRTQHREDIVARFLAVPPGSRDPASGLPRLAPHGIAPALRAGAGTEAGRYTAARPIHYRDPRVISVREAARLHSFPDWFRFHRTKWHGFRQVGNSVPPLLARAVAQSVMSMLQLTPSKPDHAMILGTPAYLHLNRHEAEALFDLGPTDGPKPRVGRKLYDDRTEAA